MKRAAILPILLFSVFLGACSTAESTTGTNNDHEYIIVGRNPSDGQDQKLFQALDIHINQSTPIFGIVETTGRIYLPTNSGFPECNKKIVQGYVSSKFYFVITKLIRDTTVPTVGQ